MSSSCISAALRCFFKAVVLGGRGRWSCGRWSSVGVFPSVVFQVFLLASDLGGLGGANFFSLKGFFEKVGLSKAASG